VSLPLLQVEDLEAGYTAPVMGPLSFQVNPGEVIGLSGPNGTGKSTLLKAVANGVHVFGGEIRKRADLEIGWMVQQPVRLAEMPFSGWEYLRFTRGTNTTPPELMRGWLNQRVDSLSGGQFQLLCLWSVLSGSGELVLLDEPTNNLDRDAEQVVVESLTADQGDRAVVVVSHERHFLEQVASRVLEITS
jgi:zinc transport system ATP-binding protein